MNDDVPTDEFINAFGLITGVQSKDLLLIRQGKNSQ